MHAAVRAAAAGFRLYFMHGGGLCGGNQLHASGTWDNGISLCARRVFGTDPGIMFLFRHYVLR
jgi:hypothetical protein